MSNSQREREREDANVVHTPLPKYKKGNKSHQHSPSAYFSRYVIAPSIALNRFEKLCLPFKNEDKLSSKCPILSLGQIELRQINTFFFLTLHTHQNNNVGLQRHARDPAGEPKR